MRIDPRRYRVIHFGMNKSEVETLFGAPPGDYGMRNGKHTLSFPIEADDLQALPAYTSHRWAHNDTSIQVWFDHRDQVRAKGLQIVRHGDTLDRIRDWIDPPHPGFGGWLPRN